MQFQAWKACETSVNTLHFDFETRRDGALIIYSQSNSANSFEFLEVKIVRGQLKIRYKVQSGNHETLQVCGDSLDDGSWHNLNVTYLKSNFTFFVDGYKCSSKYNLPVRKNLLSPESIEYRKAGTEDDDGYLFIGGIPKNRFDKPLKLSSVKYQTTFQGTIRRAMKSDCGGVADDLTLLGGHGVKSEVEDVCAVNNVCKNGGRCISSDGGPVCECHFTNYDGVNCERDAIKTANRPVIIVFAFVSVLVGLHEYSLESHGDVLMMMASDHVVLAAKSGTVILSGREVPQLTNINDYISNRGQIVSFTSPSQKRLPEKPERLNICLIFKVKYKIKKYKPVK
ncbi:hypothetical protein HELRODRAFT_175690 [Helobdella robusta]|uniref:EGF-like domain-containing protein n=1 Tax=Helobdella robusta TaxID=6412 RepID=T1F9J2_HELRO|nr:hypothetical protein HELRODRAFT_175690 [Helobdella robusta]ESO00702.1 hypothetical protein HELRODRAFT_175690 [Helobdella robusta]